ncbi:protein kinase [Actinoplanes sp. NPDC051633]|uniref:serine/threonine-protein kinase n=1 Tax=Actinoplanes sp. NPDC051633 TaxID=3155670 RepID=UPI00344574C3
MLDVGNLLDNRYRLDERIATGGMGDVWRGTDVVLGRVVAVKVLRQAMTADPEFSARFYGEARMMAAFRHPGVVEVFDYSSSGETGGDDQCAYLVMAFVEGEPLSTRLKEAGRLDVAETMSIVAQAADALHAAHQNGTVHRDVKPGNLMVKPTGAVILVDFGVARSAAVTSVTGLNSIVGTALYMAPEQVAKGNVTPATDIYALGAVAYHCIAGHPPFDGDNALQVALMHLEDDPPPLPDDVPVAVRQLITKAMAKHPDDRFGSAAEFAEAALAATTPMDYRSLTGTALTAPLSPGAPTRQVPVPRDLPASPPQPRRPKRSAGQLAVLVAVIVLGLAAAGLAALIALRPDNPTGNQVEPTTSGAAEQSASTDPEAPPVPVQSETVPSRRPNANPVPSRSPSVSPKPTQTVTPTTKPPTPTDEPTTPTTPTTEPTTPTTEPTTTEPGDGGGGDDGGGDNSGGQAAEAGGAGDG